MAEKCQMCLSGLIILCSLLTDNIGAEVDVFSSFGENVRLPCNNALSYCTSTTWTYSSHLKSVELFFRGIKRIDIEGHERLSLGSDCSLIIKKVTNKDYGFYTCRQYVKGQQYGTDARVYLHVLHVSSPSQTEIRSGSSVTLFCHLEFFGVSCDTLVRSEGFQLTWVNQAGVNLQKDSRYQISFSLRDCNSTLTTTLLNEHHNREWRCQATQRNEVKATARYTIMYLDPADTTSETLVCMTVGSLLRVIMIIVEIAVFAAPAVILLQIICARRTGRKDFHHPEEIKMSTVLE